MQDTIKYVRRLIDAELNLDYIASHTNLERATVTFIAKLPRRAASKKTTQLLKLGRRAMKPEPKRRARHKSPMRVRDTRLVPVTRLFPTLTPDMADSERIIILTNHGLAAQKIRKYLHNPQLSAEAINRYVVKKLGPAPKGNASIENQISVSFMPYVIEVLTRLGKDRYTCEICLEPVPKGCIVHHTKYEGVTVYDLMYVCGSCNLSRANKGLA